MSLSSRDKKFLHQCIYDFFLWTNNEPLIVAMQKHHPEACQRRSTSSSLEEEQQPLLVSALCQHDRGQPPSSSKLLVKEPAAPPRMARNATKRKIESSSTSNKKSQATTATTTTTAKTKTSPAFVWNDYYDVLTTMMSKEQALPDSLDPRGLLSWCVHQRWVYQKYHGHTLLSSLLASALPWSSKEDPKSASHLSVERIEKLNALGFEWELGQDSNLKDLLDRIVVDRQTPSPIQLTLWKLELERYKPYLTTVPKQSNAPEPPPQEMQQQEGDQKNNDDEKDESSVQAKAQQWLAVQIQRYREWDAGFVDFAQEQRDALHALHLLPDLTEQSDHHYRFNLLLLLLHGDTDMPQDKQENDDKADKSEESQGNYEPESESSEAELEFESDSDEESPAPTVTKTNGSTTAPPKRPLLADEAWQNRWLEMLEFYKLTGHTNVTRRIDPTLARWAIKQRAKYRKSPKSYPKYRKEKLDGIGFCWEPNAIPADKSKMKTAPSRIMVTDWNDRLAQMQAFHDKYGHVHVTNSLDAKLSSWVKKERIRYRNDKDAYPSDRKKSLDDLGFCWEPIIAIKNQENEPYPGTLAAEKDALWWKRFEELKVYKETFGHVRVPTRSSQYRELSNWYRHTKERYRRFLEGKGRFPKNRQMALEEIDFDRLSQVARGPTKATTTTTTTNPSENSESAVAVDVPTKSEDETNVPESSESAIAVDVPTKLDVESTSEKSPMKTRSSEPTDSEKDPAQSQPDPKQEAPLDPMPEKTTEEIVPGAADDDDAPTDAGTEFPSTKMGKKKNQNKRKKSLKQEAPLDPMPEKTTEEIVPDAADDNDDAPTDAGTEYFSPKMGKKKNQNKKKRSQSEEELDGDKGKKASDKQNPNQKKPSTESRTLTASVQPIVSPKAQQDDVASNTKVFHPRRAILGMPSRKRIRLPLQNEAKRPRRSVP